MKKVMFNKGVTLIALVITIIVLLILAGMSIATLTGENGILYKTQKAKEETLKSQALEELRLKVLEIQTQKKRNSNFARGGELFQVRYRK